MLERKNIDRVFQENLKDLDIYPSRRVWNNIELHLTEGIPKRKAIPLWKRLSGIAIAISLLLAGGVWYNSFKSISLNSIENAGSKSNLEVPNNGNKVLENQIIAGSENEILPTNKELKGQYIVKSKILDREKTAYIKKPNNNVIVTSMDISSIYESVENKYIVNESTFLTSLKSNESLISNNEPVNFQEEKLSSNRRRWSVGPTLAPVYYNTLQSGSPIDPNLSNNSKSSENALSVGIKLKYQLNNKINFQSGINKVELAYLTKNVSAVTSSSKYSNNTIDSKNSAILLSNSGGQNGSVSSSFDSKSKSNLTGDLNQSIEYFELPLEMKYNLYESKFGIGLVGGFSTFILTGNTVSLVLPDQSIELGKVNNLNSVNFSGNLGVDFDYKINNNWYLNVAPMFKYQFHTYSNNSGSFQPYYFGVYSGLNYRF